MKNSLLFIAIAMFYFITNGDAQIIQYAPESFIEISGGVGGFEREALMGGDRFSREHDIIGDLNGDGILDIVVGARSDDDGNTDAGAVYILFMNIDGTVASNQKISMTEGGFNETLRPNSFFGYGAAGIGDRNGDDIPDIAVSTVSNSDNSIYVIHLNRDGTVKSFVKNNNIVSQGLTAIGDIDGDGKIDLVACDPKSNNGGTARGAIRIIFLDDDSQIMDNRTVNINSTQGGFGQGLVDGDEFGGREVAMLGDLDGDGTRELAVGSFRSDGGKGSVWILSLDENTFNVVSKVKITEGQGGFTDALTLGENPNGTSGANFGHAMCAPGDLNGDGIPDLITGANQQNEGIGYILYLNKDKTVKTFTRINSNEGGFDLRLEAEERFTRSMSFVGDLRQDGTIGINIGGGAGGTGTLYILFFEPCAFEREPGNNFYNGGNTLFSNWTHNTQTVDGPLSFEQCSLKAFETNAPYITFNPADGRCICKDATAILAFSEEESTAYINRCELDNENENSCDAVSANLSGSPLSYCIDDAAEDVELDISVTGGEGERSAWLVTNNRRNIVGLPSTPEEFNFAEAGLETYLIWYLTFNEIEGLEVGANVEDLNGCFALSNSVTVLKEECNIETECDAAINSFNIFSVNEDRDESTITINDGDTFCAADFENNIRINAQTSGSSQSLVFNITDGAELTNTRNSTPYDSRQFAAEPGTYTINALLFSEESAEGNVCDEQTITFTISECIPECTVEAAKLSGKSLSYCADEKNADLELDIAVKGGEGKRSAWVVTNDRIKIVGLPSTPSDFNFAEAGLETYLIWYLNFDNVDGLKVGAKATNLSGCFALSNSVTVLKEDCKPTCNGKIKSFNIFSNGNESNSISVKDGDTFCTTDFRRNIKINAKISGSNESLVFNITGDADAKNTENVIPYDSNSFKARSGTYTVNAKLFTENKAKGSLCDEQTITFTIKDCERKTGLFDNEQSILLYPNPVTNNIEIRLNGETEVDAISIYNITGQIELNQDDISYDGTVYKANISHLSEGLYLIKTIKGDIVETGLFLKQ